METEYIRLDLEGIPPVTLFHAFFGHVDIKLEFIRLDFSLMKIKSNELHFYEWSPAPPHVECGSQLGPFFPLPVSHPLFTQS